jgi:NADH-ubiquinone oxidoreductase chain 5
MLTALINRVGDFFILLSIGFFLLEGGYNLNLTALHSSSIAIYPVVLLILARITKRAQIPFSAWLPAAIAAPTPVSSLVHSSTLVTAGVYLVIRFQASLAINSLGRVTLIRLGTITIIIAGLSALSEIDIKKIVALSTLRQLGLIIRALGCDNWVVRYFHLLAHAYVKALLFIRVGTLIHSALDYQDIRKSSLSS